ncbi:carbohydrate porin [Algivirga pacifica]|uniref:Maltoporin n=1 Tax=Algivirga pacifica TaxID=1162670 RepID=A0ABP9CX73_9BACT
MRAFCISLFLLLILNHNLYSQIAYQEITNDKVFIGTYGRVGMDWNYENNGSLGRRLNLDNMGSIGGRLEEQDYFELANAFRFTSPTPDSTLIHIQSRLSIFSKSLSYFANANSASPGGLAFAFPELYVLAKGIKGLPLNVWLGSRLYRGGDIQIADYFYFNDHSGQGFGIEYKNTRLSTIVVSSTDTTSTLPPSFFINIQSGTPSIALRGRFVYALEHDFQFNARQSVTALMEFHHLENANPEEIRQLPDSLQDVLNYPADWGWVFGARYHHSHQNLINNSFTNLSIRYGNRIANGGDGGISRTYLTFGAPNLDIGKFKGAYAWALIGHSVLQFNDKISFGSYLVYQLSKGAANTNGIAETYFGREVFNRKEDFTVGTRATYYLSDLIHLFGEVHYSQRQDGEQDPASMVKFSFAPTLVPTQERQHFARPHLRFVVSFARYNDQARETLYSPFLRFAGSQRWGHYLGVKAEWWFWN